MEERKEEWKRTSALWRLSGADPRWGPEGERCLRPTSFLCELELSIGYTASEENGGECGVTLMRRLSRV